jgi:hypothetical protein
VRENFKFAVACLLGLFSLNSAAADLRCNHVLLKLDDSSARANLAIVQGKGDENSIEAALALAGNQAILKKTEEFGYDKSRDDFAAAMRAVQSGKEVGKDYFGLKRLKEQIEETEAALALLHGDGDGLIGRVCEKMRSFLPNDYRDEIGIQIVAGGHATGFTFDDEPVFYLAANRIGGDAAGMELITVHELFHVVQAVRSPWKLDDIKALKKKNPTRGNVMEHLYNGYLEGGATFVADPSDYSGDGLVVTFFREGKQQNMKYIKRRFVTFEAYLSQLWYDDEADAEAIYAAGFYDDGPMYYVGYRMAEALVEQHGQNYLNTALDQSPAQFFLDYLQLCRSDETLPCFSANAENIIDGITKIQGADG